MNESIVNFMIYESVAFACLIHIILILDIVWFITLLVKGPYLSKYTEPVSVKCTDLIEVKVTKSVRRYASEHSSGYTDRKTAWIMRPSFSGFYNGKNLTFCRKKDFQQPVAEVGEHYTIYVKPGNTDCHDYYEEQEKAFLRKQRRKRIFLCNLAMFLMALWIAVTVYFSIQIM